MFSGSNRTICFFLIRVRNAHWEHFFEKRVEKWLRNKNTIEFLGIWEEMYDADFNTAAYEEIMLEAGLNRFIMSVKQWVLRTNSKGIIAKAGRYGGIYAYKDIAFEFASWVSPQFKLYLIKEFERLKKEEQTYLHHNRLLSFTHQKVMY